jgi:ABC-type nitrate/sulfonate/bicarbonate transport system substrate-binding protein
MKVKKIFGILVCILLIATFLFVGCKTGAAVSETTTAVSDATATTASAEASTTIAATETTAEQKLTVVKYGIQPYLDFMPLYGAHVLGLDKELGIDMQFIPFPSDSSAIRANLTGGVDISAGSITNIVDVLGKGQVPDLRIWANTCQFKGFIVMARKGEFKTFDELLKELGTFEEAQKAVFAQMKGKTFCSYKQGSIGIIGAMLANANLTVDDVKFLEFGDDAKAAAAFMKGEGDFYTGGLPQEISILNQGGYVALAGNEQIGESGLWFSNNYTMKEYLDNNKDTILKLTAIMYRANRYVNEKPDAMATIMTDYLNKAAASELTVDDVKSMQKDFIDFENIESSKTGVFGGPDSKTYWKRSVDYYVKLAEEMKTIEPGSVNLDNYVVQEAIFNDLLGNQSLMDWYNSPLK